MERKIRIVMAKPGLDGHDRGVKVLARAYRDAGMEVIYLGLRQTPEMIVNAALEEDVDVIALSILSGAHMTIFPRVKELMAENDIDELGDCLDRCDKKLEGLVDIEVSLKRLKDENKDLKDENNDLRGDVSQLKKKKSRDENSCALSNFFSLLTSWCRCGDKC